MGRAEEAVDFATEELQVAQLLTDRVVGAVGDPVVAALLLGKTAEAAERGIELTIAGDLPTDADVPSRDLVTVLGNLVDNALDAVTGRDGAPGGGHPRARRGAAARRGRRQRPGLDPEQARRVLERGWTTKASAHGLGGRGVGLALVGQVARRHGGEIRIGTSPLGGAEFAVTLRPVRVAAGGTP